MTIPTFNIWQCRGTVVRVKDGDTFVADLDLGWTVRLKANDKGTGYGVIRVLDLYCPEMNEPGGPEAKAYAEQLLPVGTQLTLTSHGLDSFGRSLSKVTLFNGADFAEAM